MHGQNHIKFDSLCLKGMLVEMGFITYYSWVCSITVFKKLAVVILTAINLFF